jgi:hypothetical protein
VKSVKEKRNILFEQIANLTGDICATVLRLEAANHSELIKRLKVNLERYAVLSLIFGHSCRISCEDGSRLVAQTSDFVNKYNDQGEFVHLASWNKLRDEVDKLNQELNAFGMRFRVSKGRTEIMVGPLIILDQSSGGSCDKSARKRKDT